MHGDTRIQFQALSFITTAAFRDLHLSNTQRLMVDRVGWHMDHSDVVTESRRYRRHTHDLSVLVDLRWQG